jgi:phosphonate transport system substrate-binding protein
VSTLTFALGPVLDEEDDELATRFARRLSDALSHPVELAFGSSYAEVADLVASGRAHLAWLPPAVFVRAERQGALLLAAVERSHGHGYRGVLFVPSSSPIREPSALASTRVAWVDPDSCAGYLFPRLALLQEGLTPDALFREQSFRGSHGSVVHAVMRGEADVGATFGHTAEDGRTLTIAGWYPWLGASGMRAVLVSKSIPPDVICASSALDADAIDDVREALLSLHESSAALLDEIFGGPRLVPAHTVDYDPVRTALARV